MHKYFSGLLLTLAMTTQVSLAKSVDKNAESKKFGAAITLKNQTALTDVLAKPEDHLKKELITEGVVKKVCEKKGCWLRLQAGEKEVRVTFKDYGFFVPTTLLNKTVKLQGELISKTLSVKDQKHFLKDEGAPSEAIKAIKSEKTDYEFVASAVEVVN